MADDYERKSDSREDAKEIIRRNADLAGRRAPFDPVYDEVARVAAPWRGGFSRSFDIGSLLTPDTMDSTAIEASNIFAAGMLAGASSPSMPWFALTLHDAGAAERPDSRQILDAYKDIAARALLMSGYYPSQHGGYCDTGLFGWHVLYLGEAGQGVYVRSIHLPEVRIAEDRQGQVDTVFREFKFTARQAEQEFGREALPEEIKRTLDLDKRGGGGKETEFTFIHAVFPADERGERLRLDRNNLPVASIWVSVTGEKVMREGGYLTLPYIVTRAYRLPNTAYCYSPGTQALADARMLNEMKRLILQSGQLSVLPPYLVPDDGFLGRSLDLSSLAVNYYRNDGRGAADFAPLQVGGDPRFSLELLRDTRQDIHTAFFTRLFQAVSTRIKQGQSPTAEEVRELAGERNFLLGPLIHQQQHEGFKPLFDRLFALLARRGELPPPPDELRGEGFDVDYISPLVLAQREGETQTVLRSVQDVAAIASLTGDPAVMDNINRDAAALRVLAQRGFPQTAITPERERDALRQARQQAQAQQQQAAAAMEMARTAPALGKAVESGSPLEALGQALAPQGAGQGA